MQNRTARITGAGNGIGKAIAEHLSKDGFFVLLVDIDKPGVEAATASIGTDKAAFYLTDITDEIQVKSLYNSIEKRHVNIDVLVNNAGIIRDNMIWNMDAADFDAVIHVNLKGTWLMCREAAKKMKQQQTQTCKK